MFAEDDDDEGNVGGVCRQFAIVFLFEILSGSIRSNSNK
jgi:hypothetical protein